MKAITKPTLVFLALVVFVLAAYMVAAAPYGPESITVEGSERGNMTSDTTPTEVTAQAGNVTQLNIVANQLTDNWQGFYGNITGAITLEDASGDVMFDWSGGDIAAAGEVYAANGSITDWGDIICVNLTGNGTLGKQGINASMLEDAFGLGYTDFDGVDETFNETTSIAVGTNVLEGCPAMFTYVSSASQSSAFNETLLTENATGNYIFATGIESGATGFDGRAWDFQMIVGEHSSAGTSTYQFYIELV